MPEILTVDQLRRFMEEEVLRLENLINNPDLVWMRVLHVEPERPRVGFVVYADGTDWDPGSGEGLYRYSEAGTWVFLG